MSSFKQISPYFLVDDVEKSANYYRDVLGFHYHQLWGGDPPIFAMVHRDGVEIMLRRTDTPGTMRPNNVVADESWDAYIRVEDTDSLHAEYAAKGAKITSPLTDREYGMREFEVEDINGYILGFAHPIA